MKCPYLTITTNILIYSEPKLSEYEAEASTIDDTLILADQDWTRTDIVRPTECLKDECGAWRDGACHYKA